MTNQQLYNKIRTHNNKELVNYYLNILKTRANLGSKETGIYLRKVKSSKA